MKTLEEFIEKVDREDKGHDDHARTPAGHPISCVTERGFERTGNDLFDFLKSYIQPVKKESEDE